jgi:hypothetical protein
MNKNNRDRFDLASFGLLVFIAIISIIRFKYLPQFIDGYYHLSTAQAFLKSGGWIGWTWWDFAPLGRPHLYPPLYHFILAGLKSSGLSGLDCVRLTEVLIVPLFFFVFWQVSRYFINSRFAFFSLLISSSFFSFFVSLSANVPASLAMILGLLSWIFFYKKKNISASLVLGLTLYTHAAIPWIFLLSLFFVYFFQPQRRRDIFIIILLSILIAAPFLFHLLKNLSYISLRILGEIDFINFSIFIILGAIAGLILAITKKDIPLLLFAGCCLSAIIIFIKYPYRLFSSQGMIGFVLLSAVALEYSLARLKPLLQKISISLIILFLFFFHPTINRNEKQTKINFANSTFYNVLTGNIYSNFYFLSFLFPQFYDSIVTVINNNTADNEIISSNLSIVSQIFSSLTNRPCANSMLPEVNSSTAEHYKPAKLVVWLKPLDQEIFNLQSGQWKIIYENDIAYIFLNLNAVKPAIITKAEVSFIIPLIIAVGLTILIVGKKRIRLKVDCNRKCDSENSDK